MRSSGFFVHFCSSVKLRSPSFGTKSSTSGLRLLTIRSLMALGDNVSAAEAVAAGADGLEGAGSFLTDSTVAAAFSRSGISRRR